MAHHYIQINVLNSTRRTHAPRMLRKGQANPHTAAELTRHSSKPESLTEGVAIAGLNTELLCDIRTCGMTMMVLAPVVSNMLLSMRFVYVGCWAPPCPLPAPTCTWQMGESGRYTGVAERQLSKLTLQVGACAATHLAG